MKVSIRDVAKAAGVSISTVSRVLNATGPVSEEIRGRVLRAVKELGYVPNANAQNLKLAQSRNIALLVRNITNPFFAPMISIIERQIHLRGYPLLVESVEDGQDELAMAIRLVREKKLCGVMMIGGTYDHPDEQFQQLSGVPCVLITFTAPPTVSPSRYASVVIDDTKEACRAVSHLIGLGHGEIGFLAKSPFDASTTGHKRLLGYQQALAAAGLAFDPSLVQDCEYTASSGFLAMRRLLLHRPRLSAVFAASDTIATGVAKAALTAGLRIPDDLSIIGFDGIEAAEYYHPALDTVAQPAADMATAGVELLFGQMSGALGNRHRIFDAALVRRGSSGRKYE